MEALSRQEYPAMLERLQPAGAVSKLNERVKRIGKVNSEVADWLQERRKVENAYVAGLRKLAQRPLQEVGGDLGVFDVPWRKIIASTEEIANSHSLLSQRIEKDVEQPLRNFSSTSREMSGLSTIQGNLAAMAKELEDAQEKSDKLNKKGGKANAQKVEVAQTKLEQANQQWQSQAPFIFESLQALDETRLNHLRDVLTQYETHEADQVERNRITVEQTLSSLLEVDTAQEIRNWSQAAVAGRPIAERRGTSTRQSSSVGNSSQAGNTVPPRTPRSIDNASELSGKVETTSDFKMKSRIGTMLKGRRQSIHGAFGRATSPNKGFVPFNRTTSRDGRPSPSPRASSSNLRESEFREARLSSLAEAPPPLPQPGQTDGASQSNVDAVAKGSGTNGVLHPQTPDLSDVQPPLGTPLSQPKPAAQEVKDSDGFTVPAASNDPISQAQSEAAQESEQPSFKLDIRTEPIQEQDADAQAALSNVANTLRSTQLSTPNRKVATVRGRRDVRNTVYMPTENSFNSLNSANSENAIPPSPGIAMGRAAALAALSSSEHGAPSISDTTSIRSGHSLVNNATTKHAEMHQPGLNASIVETVSATLENGVVTTTKINGEVALTYNKAEGDQSSLPPQSISTSSGPELELISLDHQSIRINNFPNLEAIGPNRTFIHPASVDKPDEFTIDLSPISSKSSVAFTYRVHIDPSGPITHAPILLRPTWKTQGDKLALVIEYSLNPAANLDFLTFTNLVLVAIYEGPRATACQTKPTGTHIKEKSIVYWRLGDVALTRDWHKVIARFIGAEGTVPEPGHVEARWEVSGNVGSVGSGITLSRLEAKGKSGEDGDDDPFADEGLGSPTTVSPSVSTTWIPVETARKIVGGKYEAK